MKSATQDWDAAVRNNVERIKIIVSELQERLGPDLGIGADLKGEEQRSTHIKAIGIDVQDALLQMDSKLVALFSQQDSMPPRVDTSELDRLQASLKGVMFALKNGAEDALIQPGENREATDNFRIIDGQEFHVKSVVTRFTRELDSMHSLTVDAITKIEKRVKPGRPIDWRKRQIIGAIADFYCRFAWDSRKKRIPPPSAGRTNKFSKFAHEIYKLYMPGAPTDPDLSRHIRAVLKSRPKTWQASAASSQPEKPKT